MMLQTRARFVDRYQLLGQDMRLTGNHGVVQIAALPYNSAVRPLCLCMCTLRMHVRVPVPRAPRCTESRHLKAVS